eukprot:SAG11_NODE_24238_length_376_cov_0.931408_1_plen_50_part_01
MADAESVFLPEEVAEWKAKYAGLAKPKGKPTEEQKVRPAPTLALAPSAPV